MQRTRFKRVLVGTNVGAVDLYCSLNLQRCTVSLNKRDERTVPLLDESLLIAICTVSYSGC